MILHIGSDKTIPVKDIVAILDIRSVFEKVNKSFVNTIQEKGDLLHLDVENPKSLIITSSKCYYSAISSITLKNRSKELFITDGEAN